MTLKDKLSKKLKKSGGFTLVEMLIVVAIIAILVVVSIPIITSNLEKARVATDEANERAAKGAILVEYLDADSGVTPGSIWYYDAAAGKLSDSTEDIVGYGQCSDHKDGYLKVKIADADDPGAGVSKDDVVMEWVVGSGGSSTPHADETTP